MTGTDERTITEFNFNEEEVRVLRWLFDDGLEAIGRSGDRVLAYRVATLAPRIWNIRPDIGIAFDAAEIALLARAISVGQRANRNVLSRVPVRSADTFALALLRRKILGGARPSSPLPIDGLQH